MGLVQYLKLILRKYNSPSTVPYNSIIKNKIVHIIKTSPASPKIFIDRSFSEYVAEINMDIYPIKVKLK